MRTDGGPGIAACDTAASVAHRIDSMGTAMGTAMRMAAASALPPEMR
jgi:hypothetical protein